MLHFDNIAFGPIFSRRLGSSLGVNILPVSGKFCNFDCVYCECGWNKDGVSDKIFPTAEDVRKALEIKLKSCLEEGKKVDSITFSGNGEPTLNPEFPGIVDVTVELRNRYFPEAAVSVLSNATTVIRPEIFQALKKVDNPIMKIDAPDNDGVRVVNRAPKAYSLERIITALEQFNGDFVLQTMFLKFPGYDSSAPENLSRWMDIVRRLRPREIMVYTLDRETPQKDLEKFSVEEMTEMAAPLIKEGFNIQIRG